MRTAIVTVELLPNDTSGDRLMQSLDVALSEYCADIPCSVKRKQDFPIPKSLDEGIEMAINGACRGKPVTGQPVDRNWDIYLSPRRMEFVLDNRVQLSLSTVLMVMAMGRKPVGIFLQTITDSQVPEAVGFTLYHRMEGARRRHITYAIPEHDAFTLENFTEAVGEAYKIAFSPHYKH